MTRAIAVKNAKNVNRTVRLHVNATMDLLSVRNPPHIEGAIILIFCRLPRTGRDSKQELLFLFALPNNRWRENNGDDKDGSRPARSTSCKLSCCFLVEFTEVDTTQ